MRHSQLTKFAPILVFIAATGLGGYYLGSAQNSAPPSSYQQDETEEVLSASSLFKTQTATVQGEIIKVDPSSLTVKDETGKIEEFPISERIVIYKALAEDPKRSKAYSDIKMIETNKLKVIMLEAIDGKYQIVSVSDLPQI